MRIFVRYETADDWKESIILNIKEGFEIEDVEQAIIRKEGSIC
jgi:hypothetical protein